MSRGLDRPPVWFWPFAVAAVVLLAVGVPLAMGRGGADTTTQASSTTQESTAAAGTATTDPAAPRTTVAEAMALLNQADREWTMTVLGDSTGNASDEWVYLLAQRMSTDYSRPVTIKDWSTDINSYSGETTVGSGDNAAITIWNGSASGQTAGYSRTFLDVMAAPTSDLVIVSHGHNEASGNAARAEVGDLIQAVDARQSPAPALAVILQNPRADENANRQDQVVGALRERYGTDAAGILPIDVYSVFEQAGNLPSLLNEQDQFHPNSDGERLWEQAVAVALGVA